MPESGVDEPSQGRCVGVAAKGGQPGAKWKRSRRCGVFVRLVGQGRARNLGRQEDIDRLISRGGGGGWLLFRGESFQQALVGSG